MEKTKQIRVKLDGLGFKYSLFEVEREDMADLLDNDKGVFLRNRFKKYLERDLRRVAQGKESKMIQFCTLVDDDKHLAEVSVSEGHTVRTYHLSNISGWRFIVESARNDRYEPHFPTNMPQELMIRIENLINEYLDSADDKSINALNGEYVTFFNLYTRDDVMMLCMRSRDRVHSEFSITLDADERLDIDKLCVLCRKAQDVVWSGGNTYKEYDANSLIYDSRWHTGEVSTQPHQNVEYFITTPNPTAIDARWFESWAV